MSIHTKMHEFHKVFNGVDKTGVNPHFGNKHFTLDEIVRVTTPIFNDLGLYVTHAVTEGQWLVTKDIDAESTEYIESSLPLKAGAPEQALGSGMTYFKRYNLCALLNISEKDDDGNAATAYSQEVQYITAKQAESLKASLADVEGDTAAFLNYMGAESFDKIAAADLPKAKKAIEAKARKAA